MRNPTVVVHGGVRLFGGGRGRRLPGSTEPARLAYVAADGTPDAVRRGHTGLRGGAHGRLVRGAAAPRRPASIVPEPAQWRRYSEAAGLAGIDRPGTRMALRPWWAGAIGFQTRFPGGTGAEEFQQRGR